ncbi:MAG: Asp-tRNA(Asn)/Glu-tRNA(Gln) amidotransferase subunit GatA [Candidatus Bathyarchaeota archaeon]|nr:Asp-tRNA(Asn)/Glu-tRNA(Gln) amidotransferase subunit GatA [Candidatus Bathyarchaeota archaeon]
MNILELHQKFIEKKISVIELVKKYLNKIEKGDKQIRSFLSPTPELALSLAKEAQERINQGEHQNLLCGIPCAVKDNILVENIKCTAGSKILENYISPFDATVIKKIRKAGAVILGKTNMDEFAMGSSTENSAYGVTRNPHDLTRVPGGSSGGSAAAVAAEFCQFALGSDTGGSIRQPASFCGIVGLRPTYGAVSRYGLIALASSLDQIGPLANNIEDTRIVFNAIKGRDPLDSTSMELDSQSRKINVKKLRIGIPKEYFIEGIEDGVRKRIEESISKFKKLGISIQDISLPHTEYALQTYTVVMASEASTNLARYDGIRYGLEKSQVDKIKSQDLFNFYSDIRGKYFGKEARRRIVLGTFSLSVGYYDEYYLRAQKVRKLIQRDFNQAFSKVDLILTPVAPTTAFPIGEKIDDPIKMYLADVFTVGVNLAGLPGISFPYGKANNLPVGIQLISRPFQEESMFRMAELLEKA